MSTKKEELSSDVSLKDEKGKSSIVEKIVDTIQKDIADIIETIKETENS